MEYYQVLALTAAVVYHADVSKNPGMAIDEKLIANVVRIAKSIVQAAAVEQKR